MSAIIGKIGEFYIYKPHNEIWQIIDFRRYCWIGKSIKTGQICTITVGHDNRWEKIVGSLLEEIKAELL